MVTSNDFLMPEGTTNKSWIDGVVSAYIAYGIFPEGLWNTL